MQISLRLQHELPWWCSSVQRGTASWHRKLWLQMETCDYVYIIQYLKILVPFLVSVIESHIFLGKKTSKVLIKSEFDLNWYKFLQVYLLIVCNWSVKNQSCLKKHTVQKRFNIHSSTLFLPQEHKNVLFWHLSSLNMMRLQRDPPIAGQINRSQLNLCARACALRSSQYEECSAEVAREVNKLLWYNSDIYRSDLPVRSGDGLIKVSASVTVYVGT